jgi:hypothetical protein
VSASSTSSSSTSGRRPHVDSLLLQHLQPEAMLDLGPGGSSGHVRPLLQLPQLGVLLWATQKVQPAAGDQLLQQSAAAELLPPAL